MIFGKSECDATKYENMVVSTDFSEMGDEESDSYPKFKEDSMLDILFNDNIMTTIDTINLFPLELWGSDFQLRELEEGVFAP
ncbi:hypothetical protein MTR_5g026410 [Medicago truncatula]|uniref:Uncharacterized protein n=1 Tax=Medicago truncatula TaxID=3880 RepID=G7K5G7_MEDTR|nr:hypothetical protein MTR_5g026410 [Medicago truncatula]